MPALTRTRRFLRRRRRPIAAVLAGTAMLMALTALRPVQPGPEAVGSADPTRLHSGEVSVPVVLASSALAGLLTVGDVIDLVSVPEDGHPVIVTGDARVLTLPSRGSTLSGSSSAVAMVAVAEDAALPVAAANAAGGMTFIRRPD